LAALIHSGGVIFLILLESLRTKVTGPCGCGFEVVLLSLGFFLFIAGSVGKVRSSPGIENAAKVYIDMGFEVNHD
jgi:hypothetical protein